MTEMAAELRALSDWRRPVVTGTAREPVPTRFGRLRDAAIRWLDIVADGRDGWRIPEDADWRSATVDLYLLAQDRPARTALPLVQDPARHLRRRSGTTTDPQPIELTDEASDIAELLPRNDVEVAPVVVPSSLGVYVGDALVELAGRLRRGGPFGPKPHGDNLARTAAELGRKILAHAVLTYCRSWDYDARRPRDYLSESEAREFDRTGTAYTVVLGEAARPDAIVDVHWAAEELSVSKLDDHGRPHVWWEFQRTSPAMMFLRRMTEYRYNGESTDPLDGGFVDQFNFEPDGTAHRMTWLDDQREWLESTGGGARVESLWTPVPSFGDWTSVRDLERFQPPSDGDMPVHYCLSWDDVHARPQGLILAYEARARDEEGATYGVILGELSDPRILITVSRNDNKFVVNIFDDNKRICTAHMFVRVGDRLLQRQQLRLIYPEPTTRNLREVERIAAYEVRTDGWARATVSEPDSGKLLSERIEQVDIDRYWWPTPQFGDWAWTHTLDPAPKYWVDTELAI
ncbi:hypothetical protein ACSVDM_04265 [Nocardia sp. JW2]|uniref:hypothetical protein n=1 Tax=Nocardia sp. JW2 TaxID=3450738 RepID=UPI003F41E68E